MRPAGEFRSVIIETPNVCGAITMICDFLNHTRVKLMIHSIPRRSNSAAATVAARVASVCLLCWIATFGSSFVVPCGAWQIPSPRVGRSGATTIIADRRHSSRSTTTSSRRRVAAGHRQVFRMSTAAAAGPLDGVGDHIRRVDTQESQAALVSK